MSRRISLMKTIALGTVLTLLSACTDDGDLRYARTQAFLRFTPVTAAHPLFAAVNNPGLFCHVTWSTKEYLFKDAHGNAASYPRTALDAYGRPMALAGIIVGTPSVPDFSGQHPLLAFDGVCPACYEATSVQRTLTFSAPETLHCSTCNATFDLANAGICSNAGKHNYASTLYRYRTIVYAPSHDLLTVQN